MQKQRVTKTITFSTVTVTEGLKPSQALVPQKSLTPSTGGMRHKITKQITFGEDRL
nr:MAG TPA: hypothetical protein [Caudoviricetes sp.]